MASLYRFAVYVYNIIMSASENQKALDSLDEIIRLCAVIQEQEEERLRRQTESELFFFNLCLMLKLFLKVYTVSRIP